MCFPFFSFLSFFSFFFLFPFFFFFFFFFLIIFTLFYYYDYFFDILILASYSPRFPILEPGRHQTDQQRQARQTSAHGAPSSVLLDLARDAVVVLVVQLVWRRGFVVLCGFVYLVGGLCARLRSPGSRLIVCAVLGVVTQRHWFTAAHLHAALAVVVLYCDCYK